MAREYTPVLCGAIKTFEYFITAWEKMREAYAEDHPIHEYVEVGIRWATKYYNRLDDTDAYVITMCTCFYFALS